MIKITSNGDVFARLFGNVFVWLCVSVLLIVVAILIHLDASLSAIAATIGGLLLLAAGAGWAGRKLSDEQQASVGGFVLSLIVPGLMPVWPSCAGRLGTCRTFGSDRSPP